MEHNVRDLIAVTEDDKYENNELQAIQIEH